MSSAHPELEEDAKSLVVPAELHPNPAGTAGCPTVANAAVPVAFAQHQSVGTFATGQILDLKQVITRSSRLGHWSCRTSQLHFGVNGDETQTAGPP